MTDKIIVTVVWIAISTYMIALLMRDDKVIDKETTESVVDDVGIYPINESIIHANDNGVPERIQKMRPDYTAGKPVEFTIESICKMAKEFDCKKRGYWDE